jgi:hypothetical protein
MNELKAESGRMFDPLVVSALHQWLTRQEPVDTIPALEQEPQWSSSTSRS